MVKRKDGIWQESVTINGNRKYFYGKTKSAVLKKINAYREDVALGKAFKDTAKEWWDEHSAELEHNTVKSYQAPMKRAIEEFGDMRISQITPPMIQRYIARLTRQRYARKTIANQFLVLNMILSYAVVCGYIDNNPAREISISRKAKTTKRETASDEDIETIKKSYDVPFGDVAYWALYTGCRKGELLALTWDDVDIPNGCITISKSVYFDGGKPKLKLPKTSAGIRKVPILIALEDKMKPGKGYVFKGLDGGMLTECQFRKRWDRYVKATGISCTLHQLRHAYATMLYEHSVNVLDAQKILGHANASTTQDIYTHIRDERQRDIFLMLRGADYGCSEDE